MNKKELSSYYYLKLEIKRLEERIVEIRNKSVGISRLTGMPFSSQKNNPIEKQIELIAKLNNLVESTKVKALEKQIKIEQYISEISDSDIRSIFAKRYLQFKRWDKIAMEMCMSERSVYRKHKKYLEENS